MKIYQMYQRINHLASDRNRPHSVETGCGHPPLKSHISNPLASPPKKGDDQYWEWVGWQSRCWKLKLPSCGVANPDSATVTALQPGLCSYRHSNGQSQPQAVMVVGCCQCFTAAINDFSPLQCNTVQCSLIQCQPLDCKILYFIT